MYIKNLTKKDIKFNYRGKQYLFISNDITYIDENELPYRILKSNYGDYVLDKIEDKYIEENIIEDKDVEKTEEIIEEIEQDKKISEDKEIEEDIINNIIDNFKDVLLKEDINNEVDRNGTEKETTTKTKSESTKTSTTKPKTEQKEEKIVRNRRPITRRKNRDKK